MSLSRPALALLLALLLPVAACGKDEKQPSSVPSSTSSATSDPSGGSTPTDRPSASSSTTSPAIGLPDGFPSQADVPVVSGVVTSKTGGKDPDGRIGWVIVLSAVGTQDGCFDRAAAALVAAGFTKQGEITPADTRQAQFTTAEWAVIISSRADGANCELGYEVGQLGH